MSGTAAAGPGPRRDIAFLHLPKTAGTSLRAVLTRRPGGRAVLLDYGPAPETSPEIRALQGPPPAFAALRERVAAPGGLLLAGHFPAARYWDCFNADAFVAFLRDPVARVVSEWNHHVTLRGLTQDLLTYAAMPQRRDAMTQMLGKEWRRFGFLGLTERYEASLPALSAHLGVELAAERRNQGHYPDEMPRGLVDGATAEAIARLNERDVALYAAVRACWERHGRWVPEPPPPSRLTVREVRPGLWRGVCADAECRRTWQVSVRQGGREVARLWADRHHPRLREHRGLRTGIGAFVLHMARAGLRPEGGAPEFHALDDAVP